jgi:hypothetical protein
MLRSRFHFLTKLAVLTSLLLAAGAGNKWH